MNFKRPVKNNNRKRNNKNNLLSLRYSPDSLYKSKKQFETIKEFQDEMKSTKFLDDNDLKNHLFSRLGKRFIISFNYKTIDSTEETGDKQKQIIDKISLKLKTNSKIINEFDQYCKGLVFSYPEWEQLTFPTKVLKSARLHDIIDNLASYKVYKMYDGTVLNLYRDSDRWIISSTSGIELNNKTWLGQSTYEEAFKELALTDYDRLNSNYTYTIIMKHKDFHPLDYNDYGLTLLHIFDNTTKEYISDITLDGFQYISYQEELQVTEQLKTEIKDNISDRSDIASKLMKNTSSSETILPPVYGYILRTDNPNIDRNLSNVTLETKLYYTYMRIIYNSYRTKFNMGNYLNLDQHGLKEIEDEDVSYREKLSIVKLMFKTPNLVYSITNKLIPKYSKIFTRFDESLKILSHDISKYLRYEEFRKDVDEKVETDPDNLSILVKRIAEWVQYKKLNPQKIEAKNIVTNYVTTKISPEIYALYL